MFSPRVYSVFLVTVALTLERTVCEPGNELLEPSPSFYLATDFILHLNELIKHLGMYALDDTIEARVALINADAMWNHTDAVLEELTHRSARAGSDYTNSSLHGALEAFRLERIHFIRQVGSANRAALIVGQRSAAITAALQSSVHGLTGISAGLLRVLKGIATVGSKIATGRANPTNASVETFLTVFDRTIIDTQRNYETQIHRLLRRVKKYLSEVDDTAELGAYVTRLTEIYTMFKTEVTEKFGAIGTSVHTIMTVGSTEVDTQLTRGISELLYAAGTTNVHKFLFLCLNRYVYSYFDEALAVGKVLYCGEPEIATLEYLVTVAIPILKRATISDSSAARMNIVCRFTSCTEVYYLSLADQAEQTNARLISYLDFIHQELVEMENRVRVCVDATRMDVDTYISTIQTKFTTCLNTGKLTSS